MLLIKGLQNHPWYDLDLDDLDDEGHQGLHQRFDHSIKECISVWTMLFEASFLITQRTTWHPRILLKVWLGMNVATNNRVKDAYNFGWKLWYFFRWRAGQMVFRQQYFLLVDCNHNHRSDYYYYFIIFEPIILHYQFFLIRFKYHFFMKRIYVAFHLFLDWVAFPLPVISNAANSHQCRKIFFCFAIYDTFFIKYGLSSRSVDQYSALNNLKLICHLQRESLHLSSLNLVHTLNFSPFLSSHFFITFRFLVDPLGWKKKKDR